MNLADLHYASALSCHFVKSNWPHGHRDAGTMGPSAHIFLNWTAGGGKHRRNRSYRVSY